jgi:hypothetical protein
MRRNALLEAAFDSRTRATYKLPAFFKTVVERW